jgi:hypothetical protein
VVAGSEFAGGGVMSEVLGRGFSAAMMWGAREMGNDDCMRFF